MTHRIHLNIIQPPGYIHSLGFLDQARYARHQFRQLGAEVTIGKNRLREDAINIIFGAHLGFPASLKDRFTCVFFNLEQLGHGGAIVSRSYLELLSTSAVIDYDARNLAAYGCKAGDIPVVSFEFASYLASEKVLPIEDRPIDLLFFGGVNPRRQAIFNRIEACGWNVSLFDHPLYGEERDHFIRHSKAVFNCHFYESSRFEQARAFHTLSLGTPVISERTTRTTPPPAFEDAVSWLNDDNLEEFFTLQFMSAKWLSQVQLQLQAFAKTDAFAAWEIAYSYCTALWNLEGEEKSTRIWHPIQMNIGSGTDYKPNWLNVDTNQESHPDLVLDLKNEINFPIEMQTRGGGNFLLNKNSLSAICLNNQIENITELTCLIRNLFSLLKENGDIEFNIPYSIKNNIEKIEIQLENYTNKYWNFGWIDHHFEVTNKNFIDINKKECKEINASFLCIRMKKIKTTPWEKTIARTMLMDFGGVNPDGDYSIEISH
jgi:predicted SAM-dependent methyltransferase